MKIDLYVPKLPSSADLYPLLKQVEDNRHYSNFGPMVIRLHNVLASYFGVDENQIATLSNATLALEGSVQTTNTSGPWLTPSWTYAATNLALERTKSNYQFGDVDTEWRLNKIAGFPSIMDVCPFGDSLAIDRLGKVDGCIIIDAAASFPSLQNCGDIIKNTQTPMAVVVSFHPTKVVPGVEGAVVISNNTSWIERIKAWSQFGMQPGTRVSNFAGTNAKMSEYQSIVILKSIEQFKLLKKQWLKNLILAQQVSESLGLKVHPAMEKGNISNYWIIKGDPRLLKIIENTVLKYNFETRRWWEFGCHKMPTFSRIKGKDLENTNLIAESSIGLPFHLFMGEEEFEYIHQSLHSIIKLQS
jgi:dTDP-4-amino-4,6-dideoxygalactose transaminase